MPSSQRRKSWWLNQVWKESRHSGAFPVLTHHSSPTGAFHGNLCMDSYPWKPFRIESLSGWLTATLHSAQPLEFHLLHSDFLVVLGFEFRTLVLVGQVPYHLGHSLWLTFWCYFDSACCVCPQGAKTIGKGPVTYSLLSWCSWCFRAVWDAFEQVQKRQFKLEG
jgi:hypothetical protein